MPAGHLRERLTSKVLGVDDVLELTYKLVSLRGVKHELLACVSLATRLDQLDALLRPHVLLHHWQNIDREFSWHAW